MGVADVVKPDPWRRAASDEAVEGAADDLGMGRRPVGTGPTSCGSSVTSPARVPVSGRDWADPVKQACDRVLAACINLDPPDVSDGPVRSPDGRPVWVAPTEPGLTSDLILAIEARQSPERASSTVDAAGLDVLQASAARAVAGDDTLVLVVGPAASPSPGSTRRAGASRSSTSASTICSKIVPISPTSSSPARVGS